MLVAMEVQIVQQFRQGKAVTIQTLSEIMLRMHSMITTRRIRFQLAAFSVG